jgi:Subtilase family
MACQQATRHHLVGCLHHSVRILFLTGVMASMIFQAFGVKGWTLNPEWNTVFSNSTVSSARNNTVYVIAAGNDGISQTQNIAWNAATNPALIVVGSVNRQGVTSETSNRPDTACLLQSGACYTGSRLADRFVVARFGRQWWAWPCFGDVICGTIGFRYDCAVP